MDAFPISYIEPVFRPPSEAQSLILPLTNGCSWNRCTFCDMYTAPQKKFRPRDEAEFLESLKRCGAVLGRDVQRVFLADGDALTLSTRRLVKALTAIRRELPGVRRISSYCLPRNVAKKSVEELKELADLGLSLAYVGAESGDDEVLARVDKGETFDSTLSALEKLREAGIKRSVMILNGLGGKIFSRQHAQNSARLANAAQPEFLATLVVSFPNGLARFREKFPEFQELEIFELIAEMRLFVETLELEHTVFRADHASNWLVLKGNLPTDKAKLLAQLDSALQNPAQAGLRPAWARGL